MPKLIRCGSVLIDRDKIITMELDKSYILISVSKVTEPKIYKLQFYDVRKASEAFELLIKKFEE